jgi:tripartite-type tricarboxylate transporter receptor subunit TctC
VLAVSGQTRSEALPHIPTTGEAGYPDTDYIFWIGVFAPAGTPQPIIARLQTEITKALTDPGVKDGMKKLATEPFPMTPSEFDQYIRKEIDSNARIVKDAGIKLN